MKSKQMSSSLVYASLGDCICVAFIHYLMAL